MWKLVLCREGKREDLGGSHKVIGQGQVFGWFDLPISHILCFNI